MTAQLKWPSTNQKMARRTLSRNLWRDSGRGTFKIIRRAGSSRSHGTVVDVTDYWLVDGRLHFLTVDERGEKAVEHVLPFDTLDLQTTVDVNTGRGFRFQLRSESMEQYFRNHPEVVPMVDPSIRDLRR